MNHNNNYRVHNIQLSAKKTMFYYTYSSLSVFYFYTYSSCVTRPTCVTCGGPTFRTTRISSPCRCPCSPSSDDAGRSTYSRRQTSVNSPTATPFLSSRKSSCDFCMTCDWFRKIFGVAKWWHSSTVYVDEANVQNRSSEPYI